MSEVPVEVDDGYTVGDYAEQSEFQDVMQAPIIQENAVDDSSTNGICVLFDYKTCKITWLGNQVPTLQLIYPKDGKFVRELQTQRIIIGDINRSLTHQKFRITEVIPTDQDITVNATHIIGEYLIHNPIRGSNLPKTDSISQPNVTASWVLGMIINNLVRPVPSINIDSDVMDVKNVNLDTSSTDALNLIIDPDQQGDAPANSVLAIYGGDFVFDNTTIYHRKNAGRDRNIWVRYGQNIKSYSQDRSINDTYVAIYPYATYSPGQALATKSNINWSDLINKTDWSSIGSVTYSAGGSVDVYDCPVAGQTAIRKLTTGQKLKLGPMLNDGTMLTSITGTQVQVNTMNGDGWYPIAPEDGGGWIESAWVNFSKNGDYLINDATGHVTVTASGTDTPLTRWAIKGTATVTYTQGNQRIHVYYSPDQGPDHYRVTVNGKPVTYKNGERIEYDYIAVDENGKRWYRIGPHGWLYGDHLSINKETDVQAYQSNGYGYVKKTAKKYNIDEKSGKVVEETKHLSLAEAKKLKKKKYITVVRGTGKNRKKVQIPNPDYLNGGPIKQKEGYYSLNYGQIVVAGTVYYKLSNGSYVKKSDIDQKKKKTQLPESPSKIESKIVSTKGKIQMYSTPSKGSALNWSIPVGESFDVSHTAEGADGKTWYEVTYKGKTGWIMSESTSSSAPTDMEPTTSDNDNPYGEDDEKNIKVDEQVVRVELDESFDNVYNGALYAENVSQSENAHILRLDLSNYIKHDDQDQSGLQDDGTWQATQDDKQQLYQAAINAMQEYAIGEFPITMQVEYADLDGTKSDLLALSMYDTVNVDFTQFDKVEKGRVSGTVWNMAGEYSSYDSVTIGEPPKTWAHTLLDQAKETTNQIVSRSASRTKGLLNQYDQVLQKEGSSRLAAERQLMKQLGLIQEVTDSQGKKIDAQLVSFQNFENRMDSIQNQAQEMVSWVYNVDQKNTIKASPDWHDPTMLTATTSDGGTMAFSPNGLVFYDPWGNERPRTGITSDGKVYADSILAGTIEAVNIRSCLIESALTIGDETGMNIYIGTENTAGSISSLQPDDNTSNVIWVVSNNYEAMYSSGQVAVRHKTNDYNVTAIHPSYISVQSDDNHVLTQNNFATHIKAVVQGWIGDMVKKTALK